MKRITVLTLTALAVAAGCSKKPANTANDVQQPPIVTKSEAAPTEVRTGDTSFQPRSVSSDDIESRSLGELNKGYLKDTFFDFDRSDLRADQRPVLDVDGQWLRKHATIRFRIEGHCDERGTAQYNLALGERRAETAREYLAALGVETKRAEVVSYGKERPFADGHDESAWAQNRRDHFVITAK